MSNDNTDHLFTLIKSLGKAEKRHFKTYSRKHVIGKQNRYVSLFDAIEKQSVYNEDVIRANPLFSDFYSLKKRLYRSVLRSLEVYHTSTGIDVRSFLDQIEILFDKSLFEHCIRRIRKAKKTIQEHELFEEWLEILKWEYRIAVKKFDMPLRMEVLREEKRVLHLLNNQKRYRDLANLFSYQYQRFGTERSPVVLLEMEKRLSSSLFKDESQALSFRAKQNFFDCYYLFSLIKEDYESSYRFSRKIADIYLEKPALISSNPSSYLTAINNLLVACNGMKKFSDMLEYLDRLEVTRKELRSASDRTTAFFYIYHLLNYYISTGQFKESETDVKRIEAELVVHENSMNQVQKIIFYAAIAQVYFGMEKYRRCLFWLNKIMSLGEMKVRPDIECFIRLFYLLAHFEARSDRDLMASLYKSTYRFLYKHQRMYKFEATMMQFMRRSVFGSGRQPGAKQLLLELKKSLLLLSKDPYEKHALNYFDFISWIESKIEQRPFASVLRGKNKD